MRRVNEAKEVSKTHDNSQSNQANGGNNFDFGTGFDKVDDKQFDFNAQGNPKKEDDFNFNFGGSTEQKQAPVSNNTDNLLDLDFTATSPPASVPQQQP
jgi:hypothetical protein